jgi:hypothetical protein
MMVLTRELIAELNLLGMGADALGGCYLAYDLLGGKHGPLREIARTAGYIALFFLGYTAVLGWRYAIVAATGMGILLPIEFRIAGARRDHHENHRGELVFSFLRGLVLGLAGIWVAGREFGILFGLFSGVGLSVAYSAGYAPTHDYEVQAHARFTRHKLTAAFWRFFAVSVAGVIAEFISPTGSHWMLYGLRLGLAAGVVSAIVSLFSPSIEWYIENLPDKRLGVIGLGMILAGMVLQSTQYWVVVFDVPMH